MAAPLPRIAPAIPTLVALFHRPGWVHEEKVDGWRILAYERELDVQLVSRTGRDHTARFPDVARAIAALRPRTLILDGEVAVFDEQLVSRFPLKVHVRHGGTFPVGGGGLGEGVRELLVGELVGGEIQHQVPPGAYLIRG